MGWTFYNKQRGKTIFQEFSDRFNYNKDTGHSGKVLACKTLNRVAYMAYEVTVPATDKEPAKKDVIGLVCLLQYRPKDEYWFGYKDISEEMGPCESQCPKEILDLLTPTDYEYAIKWRERCRANIEKRNTLKGLKPGARLRFAEPISFTDGTKHQELTLSKVSRGTAHFKEGYRVRSMAERKFEVIA